MKTRRRRFRRGWGNLILAALTVGCTVGPDYHPPPPPVAATWSSSHEQAARMASLVGWWRRFGDPVLDQLIKTAAAGNTDVEQAVARLRQARETAVQAGAALSPELSLSASATRSRSAIGAAGSAAGLPGGGYATSNSFAPGFDTSYELDIFGGRRREVESAGASADARQADLADTLLSVYAEVASSYMQFRGYQARLNLARRTVALRQDNLALARARALGGTGAVLDAVQAEAELENARAAIPPLEQSTREMILHIAVLTGQQPTAIAAELAEARPVPYLVEGVNPDPPVVALARRPDIRAAERRIAAATANIGVAEADRLPAISLAGSIGLNSTRLSGLTRVSSNVWSIGPTLDLPIFDAGRRTAVVQQRMVARDEAIATWRGKVVAVVEDVEKALTAIDRERSHEAALHRTVAAYADSVSLSLALYRAGMGNYADVITAQRSLATAQDSLIQSRTRLAVNAISLFKALGGGWGETAQMSQ